MTETYNAKQVSKMLGLDEKTVGNRAKTFGFKKILNQWKLTLHQVEQIKSYVPKRFINTKFRFSDDGDYLIINSKINQCEV